MAVQGRSEKTDWKWNNSSTRTDVTNHINIMRQKYYKQKQISNADSVNNWWDRKTHHISKSNIDKRTINIHYSVRAQLHLNIFKEIGIKYTTNTGTTMYQNHSKQGIKVRLPYYGTNKCAPTELFLTINRTSKSVIIKKNMHVNRCCNPWRQKCDQERSWGYFKI